MKKQINELMELAEGYAVFGVEAGLEDGHNKVRGKKGQYGTPDFAEEGEIITIYLANGGSTWSIDFGEVSIVGYTKKVHLPYDVTEEMLIETIADVKPYLHDYLLPNVAKCRS